MSRNAARPLSPHLTIWRWGPHMLVSILHRATGTAMATAGAVLLIWWLTAMANGPTSYASFIDCLTYDASPPFPGAPPDSSAPAHLGLTWFWAVVLIGLTWSFLQHLCSGLRHFVLDSGAGYELKTNKFWAMMTMVVSTVATAAIWLPILLAGR